MSEKNPSAAPKRRKSKFQMLAQMMQAVFHHQRKPSTYAWESIEQVGFKVFRKDRSHVRIEYRELEGQPRIVSMNFIGEAGDMFALVRAMAKGGV